MYAKQMIIVRRDLKNKSTGAKVRTGKIVTQCCHGTNAILLKHLPKVVLYKMLFWCKIRLNNAWYDWLNGSFTKICVYVDNEAELLRIYQLAQQKGISAILITDKGLTEFGGVPTNTAVALEPRYSDDLIGVTDALSTM